MGVNQIRRIAVVGAGLMGHGYAQEFALAGYPVHLQSRSEESVQRAMTHIRRNLDLLIRLVITPQRAEGVPAKIQTTTVLKDAVEDADLVVESIYEDRVLKQRIFTALDTVCPPTRFWSAEPPLCR